MSKLLHFCWVYVDDNEGQEANKNSFFSVSLSRMQPSSISRMLMGAGPSYCHVDWVHGFHAFFRFGNLQSWPKNATNYSN